MFGDMIQSIISFRVRVRVRVLVRVGLGLGLGLGYGQFGEMSPLG